MKKYILLISTITALTLLCACTASAPMPEQTSVVEESSDNIQGLVSDNKYENKAIGIGFSVPKGWTFYSDSEIESSLGTPITFSNDPTMQTSEVANYFCDTAAFSEDFKSAVIVTVEEKRESTLGLLQETLVDNTISLAKKDGDQIYDKFEIEKKQFKLGDGEVWGYDAVSTHEKTSLHQRCLLTDNDKYITTVMITSPDDSMLEELTEKFYFVK